MILMLFTEPSDHSQRILFLASHWAIGLDLPHWAPKSYDVKEEAKIRILASLGGRYV